MLLNFRGAVSALLLVALCLAPSVALAGESAIKTLGTGSSVTCDTTPNAGSDADDTSIANTQDRVLACVNTSSTTVYLGGSSVAGSGTPLAPSGRVSMRLAADVVPKCYAASSATIACTEYVGSGDVTGAPIPGGSRVELLASGTDTTTATAATTIASVVVPGWAHSVQFLARVKSVTTPGTGLLFYYTPYTSSDFSVYFGSTPTWYYGTGAVPAAGVAASIVVGQRAAATTGAYVVSSINVLDNKLFTPFIRFGRVHSTSSTAIEIEWWVYGYGG